MSDIVRYYDASKNPGTPDAPAMFPGVPLRDLTEEDYDALPEWLQRSVDASPMYRKTKPAPAAAQKGVAHASR